MARKGIPHREALAKRIKRPATSVRRSFNDAWEGEITGPILVALSRELDVAPHRLISDPRHPPSLPTIARPPSRPGR